MRGPTPEQINKARAALAAMAETAECFNVIKSLLDHALQPCRVAETEETVALLGELLDGDKLLFLEKAGTHYEIETNEDGIFYSGDTLLDALRAATKDKGEAR